MLTSFNRHASFSTAYAKVLSDLFHEGEVASPRGLVTRELLHYSFLLTNPRARTLNVRKASTSYCIAEALWYLLGNNDAAWIGHYAGFWLKIQTPAGKSTSAYGFKWHGQLPRILDELRSSVSSRRAVVNILTPQDYGNLLDVPCTIALHYFVRNGKLHAQTYMRSCDIVWGLPYDVFSFTTFQEILALELGLELGNYVHTATSLHLYERHASRAMNAAADLAGHLPHPKPMGVLTLPIPLTALEEAEAKIRKGEDIPRYLRELPRPWDDWARVLITKHYSATDPKVAEIVWQSLNDAGLRGSNHG